MPEAVSGLTVNYVNTTAVQLTWLRPRDHQASYTYLLIVLRGAQMVQNVSTTMETYTVSGLSPGYLYSFQVFTVVEGVESAAGSVSTHTSMFYILVVSLIQYVISS